jgi:hypothetical protein
VWRHARGRNRVSWHRLAPSARAAGRVGGRRYPRHSPVDGQRQCGNMRNATNARLLTSAPLSAADSQGAEGGDHRFFR